MTFAGDLRATQLAAVVATLAKKPGLTAYMLGIHVPVPQPGPAGQARAGLLATSAPVTLVLNLLNELQGAGRLQKTPGPSGDRWYLIGTAGCSDCGDSLTVASDGARRYCRVDAGGHLAAGDAVEFDQDPADGEAPRTETDCRGSGIYDCPCEADGPDGLCACCRRSDENGSCRHG